MLYKKFIPSQVAFATSGAHKPTQKGTSTASFMKAKLLFIRVLLALGPAQYALLRVQRYNFSRNPPNNFKIFYVIISNYFAFSRNGRAF